MLMFFDHNIFLLYNIGGEPLSPYSIDEMRERQERTAKMDTKRDPIRRQVRVVINAVVVTAL